MLKFAKIFSNNALLQRDMPINVWGFSDKENSKVIVKISNDNNYVEERETIVKDGKFLVSFSKINDVKSQFLVKAECDGESVCFSVKFGDLYLSIGQSNMAYSISSVETKEEYLKKVKKSDIRFFDIHERAFKDTSELVRPYTPLEDLPLDNYKWIDGKDPDMKGMSAIGLMTAVELNKKTGVSQGVINASTGGLCIETYIKKELLEGDKDLFEFTKRVGRYQSKEEYNNIGGRNYTQSFGLYNEKIAPLVGLNFKGIIWYLGESAVWDFEFAKYYLVALRLLVKDLKASFGNPKFISIQIAPLYYPYGDKKGYLYINEAMDILENEIEDYISIPIYDIEPRYLVCDGETYYHPIHPVNKKPISVRVADALTQSIKFPKISKVDYLDGKAIAEVENCIGKLNAESLFGFTIAGEDNKFYPASAKLITGNKIEISSVDVKNPKKITYAFTLNQSGCKIYDDKYRPLRVYREDFESVGDNYLLLPEFLRLDENLTTESAFGTVAGTFRNVKIWDDGVIYKSTQDCDTQIEVGGGQMQIKACPKNSNFFYFGVSPTVCLSGHNHSLEKFDFINLKLKSNNQVDFYGLVFRTFDGDCYRFDLKEKDNNLEFLPVNKEYSNYTISLKNGVSGDSAPKEFNAEFRKGIVQLEFLFRSKEKSVVVYMKDLILSDVNTSDEIQKRQKEDKEARTDTILPE